ncbi:MAG: Ig-like domain-containing protein, partial [Draconibacterium sp.]|nr:Ig-like domain-containing protein [Draconibacterium sp.]
RTLAERTFAFTAEDVVSPAMVSVNPSGGIVNVDRALKITFNENVTYNDAAGQIEIRYANGQIFEKVNPSACTFASVAPWTVTIPHADFDAYKGYYVVIPAGAITDVSYNKNPYAGFMNNTTWTFNTGDATNPYVLTYSPLQGEQNVIVDANLVLTFSENITLNTGNLVIYHNNGAPGADGNAMEIIPFNSPKIVVSGTSTVDPNKATDKLTINPTMMFDALGEYYVRIDAGFGVDGAGNNYGGINDNVTWKFGITDPTPPTLLLTSNPANGDVNVKKMITDARLKFDRDIYQGTGSFKLFQYDYNAATYAYETKLVETINASMVTVDHPNHEVVLSFATQLEDNTVYYILADNGSVTNTATSLNWWAGISDPFAYRFTTGDNTAPMVTASPAMGNAMANVFDVELTFNETVTGVDVTSVTVTGGTMMLSTVTAGTVYKVTVTADDLADVVLSVSGDIKDANNNALAAVSFSYKVDDNNAPTLVATPNAGTIATNVFYVNLTFNEPVVNVESAISANNGALVSVTGCCEVDQVNVTAQCNSPVTLTVSVDVEDLAGWKFAGASYTYNVVGDAVAPAVVGLVPADGTGVTPETGVVKNPTLKITFSEPVVVGTSGKKINVFKQDVSQTNTLVFSTVIDSSMISTDGLTLSVPVITPLVDNQDYVILVDKELVKSMFGVNFMGIDDPTVWNFRTGDNTEPMLTIIPGALTNTKNDIVAVLVFTEPVYHVDSAVVVTGATEYSVTGTDGDDNYIVNIKAEDLANVNLTVNQTVTDKYDRNNLAAAKSVDYVVGDNTKPTVDVVGVVEVNTVTVTLTFNENVYGVAEAVSATNIIGTPVVTGADSGMVYTVIMNAEDLSSVMVMVANTVKDANNNAFAGGSYGPYVIGDNTAPTAVVSPSSATNAMNTWNVTVTFSEPVIINGGITVTGGTGVITNVDNVYTVAIKAADKATVKLMLSDKITDASANKNKFVASEYTYVVGDNTAPTVVASPSSGTLETNQFEVVLTFNENVTGVASGVKVSAGTVVVSGSGMVYTAKITAPSLSDVALTVDNIKDMAGNMMVARVFNYKVTGLAAIADIQGTGDVSNYVGSRLQVKGTVTAVAPGEGFFMQDANAAWSGIWVEFSAATYEGIQIGNGVSVVGEVAEVANVTSIISAIVQFVPPMIEISPILLQNPSDAKAEKYESVLVAIDGARATAASAGSGEWTIYYQQSNNLTINDWLYDDAVVVKDHYYDVKGIVNGRLDGFKLEPRIESDVKDITVLTGIDPVPGNDFKVYPNPFNDEIKIDNNEKLTRVVISNIAGQRVIDIEYPENRIRTANLVSGIYVISLYTENGIAKTERMIKR